MGGGRPGRQSVPTTDLATSQAPNPILWNLGEFRKPKACCSRFILVSLGAWPQSDLVSHEPWTCLMPQHPLHFPRTVRGERSILQPDLPSADHRPRLLHPLLTPACLIGCPWTSDHSNTKQIP